MNRVLLTILTLFLLTSCSRQLKKRPSILESYRQYQVLVSVKKELRTENVNLDRKKRLIAFGEELAPQDSELRLLKASVYKAKGDISSAKLALEEAIYLSPTYSLALSTYGEFLISNGNIEEGRNYCLYAVKLNPIDSVARLCSR